MTMTFQFDIPNPITDFIRSQTLSGGFKSEGEYLLDLIERDRICVAKEELEFEILKGLRSGTASVDPREFLRQKRAEIERRVASGEFPP
jgi:Arc/MetJ-type ribon-helix-helix transcriptional regulator